LILVAAERARDFPQKPVYLLGIGESVETAMVNQLEDFTSARALRVVGLCRGRYHGQRRHSIHSYLANLTQRLGYSILFF
jgi:hypothetical protein